MAIQTATRYAENMIIDIGQNIANHNNQFDSNLFKTDTDYFQKLGRPVEIEAIRNIKPFNFFYICWLTNCYTAESNWS